MSCEKCGYSEKEIGRVSGNQLCSICIRFAPSNKNDFKSYLLEKIDWKVLDSFRKYGQGRGKIRGMVAKAVIGKCVTRPPKGYDLINGELQINQESSKVHSLFKTFLNREYSLNSLAKNFGLSTNGLKKILTNRTYLGEVKFTGKIYRGTHKAIISPEIFYAVERKLKSYLKPRRN